MTQGAGGRRPARSGSTALAALGLVCAGAVLGGCAAIPADVDRTLDRVRDGELRVGITHNPPWTDTSAPTQPAGRDVDLVERFAESLDADIVWTVGSEAVLVDDLDAGALDLAVGGFTDDTPWAEKAALTRPFREDRVDGAVEKHVMLTVPGENRFLTTLETFLSEQGGGS
jgi:hypothetical protein